MSPTPQGEYVIGRVADGEYVTMTLIAGQEYIDAVLSISLLVGILLFFLGLFNMVRLPERSP